MSLADPEDRNPYRIVGVLCAMRYQGSSDEEIAKSLRFKSVEEMRARLKSWTLPDWLIGTESKSGKTEFVARVFAGYRISRLLRDLNSKSWGRELPDLDRKQD